MTWNVVRDDTAKRIIATAEGEFHAAETLQMLSALRDSGGLTYGLLFDVRRMRGAPTVAGLKPFTEITNPAAAGDDTRGPLAIVATGSVQYGIACAFAVLSKLPHVQIHRDRAEAEQWLASQRR